MTSRVSGFTGTRLRSAALVAALALSVSACSGTAEAPPTGTPTAASTSPSAAPTASVTATPTPSYKPADASGRARNVPVPVLPEIAKSETKEGLEAFARYWFELLSYGYETGDTAALEKVTSPECRACERAKEVITGWHRDGRWLVGGQTDTPSVNTSFLLAPDGNFQVAVQVTQAALSYYNPDGTLNKATPKPEDTGNLMLAVFRDGAWYVNNIQRIVG